MWKNGLCLLCRQSLIPRAEHLRPRWFEIKADGMKTSQTSANLENILKTRAESQNFFTTVAEGRHQIIQTTDPLGKLDKTTEDECILAKPLRPVKGKSSENPVKRFVDWTEVVQPSSILGVRSYWSSDSFCWKTDSVPNKNYDFFPFRVTVHHLQKLVVNTTLFYLFNAVG